MSLRRNTSRSEGRNNTPRSHRIDTGRYLVLMFAELHSLVTAWENDNTTVSKTLRL